jgi:hypothetical protein
LQAHDLAPQVRDIVLQLRAPQLEIGVLTLELPRFDYVAALPARRDTGRSVGIWGHDLIFIVPRGAGMSLTPPGGPPPVERGSASVALAREMGRIGLDMLCFRAGTAPSASTELPIYSTELSD